MTTLDQAFIKAFSQQGGPKGLTSLTAPTSSPVFKPQDAPIPLREEDKPTAAIKTSENRVAAGPVFERQSAPGNELFSEVLALLNRPLVRDAGWLWAKEEKAQPSKHPPGGSEAAQTLPEVSPAGDLSSISHSITAAASLPTSPIAPAVKQATPASAELRTAEVAEEQPPAASDLPRIIKAAWQVEKFIWPKTCQRLLAKAQAEWERLCEALLKLKAEGKTTLAFTACRRGEGTTTLLLCVAKCLSRQGIKLALADADLERPRLAKRLGIQPQLGWNEAAKTDTHSLQEALVESTTDNLVILAAAEFAGKTHPSQDVWRAWPAFLQALKGAQAMVLIDAGPLTEAPLLPPWTGEGNVDAVLLVHNARLTTAEQIYAAQRRLASTGMIVAGVIENFAEESGE